MKKIYFVALLALSTSLYAQEQQDTVSRITEVMINENGLTTPISKQNRNVYIIDKATIAKLPARSVQELLQYANGVDLRQRGPFGSQADISIDGGSFEQTVVLLNGAKIMDSQTAHNMLNLPVPIEAIERIEIIRGPAARVYGVNSLTGVINIITRTPEKTGLLVNAHSGTNFEKNTEGNGKTFYGSGIQLGTTLHSNKYQQSIFGSHDRSNGHRYNTQFENTKFYYQGNVQLNASNELSASFGYITNDFGANGFYAAPGDRNSTEKVQTTLATIQTKHLISENFTLQPRLSYRYNIDDYRYLGATATAGRSKHFTNSIAADVTASYKTRIGEFGFGTEVRKEDINSSNIGEHNRDNLGIYAQYRTNLSAQLNVNIGSYFNYNSDYKWQTYPGIDVSYALTETFKIIGNIGTSQRIPSFTDLYLNQRPANIGNPDLKPENAFQTELGFKYLKNNFSVNTNFFQRRIAHFIDWTRAVNTDPWQSNNVGDMITDGLNIRSNYTMAFNHSTLNINLAYSYLDTKFKKIDLTIASKYQIATLKHQLTNTVDYRNKNFSILMATRFNERASGASYWINDIRLSQTIKQFTIFADAQNIFNTVYYEIGAIPLPAKWVSLGVKFSTL